VSSARDNIGIIIKPYLTEKTLKLMEKTNTLTFIVDRRATKHEIKRAVEDLFNVKVEKVRTLITPLGQKRAYVKLSKGYSAMDIASKMGLV
jgi:large subunit ribosomal protein L23